MSHFNNITYYELTQSKNTLSFLSNMYIQSSKSADKMITSYRLTSLFSK